MTIRRKDRFAHRRFCNICGSRQDVRLYVTGFRCPLHPPVGRGDTIGPQRPGAQFAPLVVKPYTCQEWMGTRWCLSQDGTRDSPKGHRCRKHL